MVVVPAIPEQVNRQEGEQKKTEWHLRSRCEIRAAIPRIITML